MTKHKDGELGDFVQDKAVVETFAKGHNPCWAQWRQVCA